MRPAVEGDFVLLWALAWFPGRLRRDANWVTGWMVLAISALSPWAGLALVPYAIYRASHRDQPAYGILHILYNPTQQRLWLDCAGRRHPLRARWLGKRKVRITSPPFVLYADEFSPADFARLRRCVRGVVAVRE